VLIVLEKVEGVDNWVVRKPLPQVKITVTNITQTTINSMVAIKGERDLYLENIFK